MQFTSIQIDASGCRGSTLPNDTDQLEPNDGHKSLLRAVFSRMLQDHALNFDETVFGMEYVRLNFTAERSTAAVASFYLRNKLASTSVLLSGSDDQADATALQAFHRMLVQAMHDTGIKLGFDPDDFPERPAVITVHWLDLKEADQKLALESILLAVMGTCLTAAFFNQME